MDIHQDRIELLLSADFERVRAVRSRADEVARMFEQSAQYLTIHLDVLHEEQAQAQ